MKQKSRLFVFLFLLCTITGLTAQETAEDYFRKVSEFYGTIEDYEADLTITRGEEVQKARISYKSPNKLHLEFSEPEGQVLNIDNDYLKLFVPSLSVSFTQELKGHSQDQLAAMATSQGLNLLLQNYGIGYLEGPQYIPLDPGSDEEVIKLKLTWRTANEGFKLIEICIGSNNLIRRITGHSTTGAVVQFDFEHIIMNQGIPDARFDYELPPVGNAIINFLFDPEDQL